MHTDSLPVVSPNGRTGLQLLRVVAIVMLVGYHAALIAPDVSVSALEHMIRRVSAVGWVGTDLFLAIAGFLMVDSWRRTGNPSRWLVRRALRVLPAYWLFLFLYLHVIPWAMASFGGELQSLSNYGAFDKAIQNQPYLFTLTTNLLFAKGIWIGAALEPLLTIAIGAQLTLLATLLMPLRRGVAFLGAVATLECVGIALRIIWRSEPTWRCYSFPLTRCDAFLFGAVAAWALDHPRLRARVQAAAPSLLRLGIGVGFFAVLATRGLDVGAQASVQFGYPLIGIGSASAVLGVSQAKHLCFVTRARQRHQSIESSRRGCVSWVAEAGTLTYAAYLFKLPIMDVVKDMMTRSAVSPNASLLVLLGGTSTFGMAWLWLRLVERPISSVVSRFWNSQPPHQAP